MCQDCGCDNVEGFMVNGKPVTAHGAAARVHGHGHSHEHEHGHSHGHGHSHEHGHEHGHSHEHKHENVNGGGGSGRTVNVYRSVFEKNDRLAERNRGFFQAKNLFVLNILSSPGSGKTTLIRETIRRFEGKLRIGVIVGDLQTENDAERLRETGAPVVQITTGTVCHLDATMISKAITRLNLDELDVLIIENVGNLVCPASYDLGEDVRVVLLSVTEGEDKPLKYPPMFQSADAAVVTKNDLAGAVRFDVDAVRKNIGRVSPKAAIIENSVESGEGMETWCEFVSRRAAEKKAGLITAG